MRERVKGRRRNDGQDEEERKRLQRRRRSNLDEREKKEMKERKRVEGNRMRRGRRRKRKTNWKQEWKMSEMTGGRHVIDRWRGGNTHEYVWDVCVFAETFNLRVFSSSSLRQWLRGEAGCHGDHWTNSTWQLENITTCAAPTASVCVCVLLIWQGGYSVHWFELCSSYTSGVFFLLIGSVGFYSWHRWIVKTVSVNRLISAVILKIQFTHAKYIHVGLIQ